MMAAAARHLPVRARCRPIWPHLLMAAYGAGWAVTFEVGLRVYVAEIVTFAGLALLKWWPLLRHYPMVVQVLWAYALWAFAIVVSDLVNGTMLLESLRNLSTPIIGAAGLIFVSCAVARAPAALLTMLAAMGIAKAVLGEPLYGDAFADLAATWDHVRQDTNFFKVRFEPFITPLVICLAVLLSRRTMKLGALLLIAVGGLYTAVDARSAGLVMFLAGLAVMLIHFGFRTRLSNILGGGLIAVTLFYGAYAVYVGHSLNSDTPGHNSRQLQVLENPYNPLSLLLVGRSEWLVMPLAIAERPIFGWGSWARDEDNRFNHLRALRIGSETASQFDRGTDDLYIPAHSVIGSAWLWSGLLGLAAMAWLFRLILTMVRRLPNTRPELLPALACLTALMVWHFLFSPPQSVRLVFPMALGPLIVLTRGLSPARSTLPSVSPKRVAP